MQQVSPSNLCLYLGLHDEGAQDSLQAARSIHPLPVQFPSMFSQHSERVW